MTGEDYMAEQVEAHRETCDVIAALLEESGAENVTEGMVSDVLASAGLHVVPMMLPPHLLYAQAYMGRK
jgi:hypothetical protein